MSGMGKGGMAEKESPPVAYANVMEVTGGAFDIVFDFGFKPPESSKRQSPDYDVVARVAMSWSHAKSMLPILARLISAYEQDQGTIPAPGFEDQSKGG